VILLVDNREKKSNSSGNYIFERLQKCSIKSEEVTLSVGDFLWILRVKNPFGEEEEIEDDE
jgi:ERCC4-type nuclease